MFQIVIPMSYPLAKLFPIKSKGLSMPYRPDCAAEVYNQIKDNGGMLPSILRVKRFACLFAQEALNRNKRTADIYKKLILDNTDTTYVEKVEETLTDIWNNPTKGNMPFVCTP